MHSNYIHVVVQATYMTVTKLLTDSLTNTQSIVKYKCSNHEVYSKYCSALVQSEYTFKFIILSRLQPLDGFNILLNKNCSKKHMAPNCKVCIYWNPDDQVRLCFCELSIDIGHIGSSTDPCRQLSSNVVARRFWILPRQSRFHPTTCPLLIHPFLLLTHLTTTCTSF